MRSLPSQGASWEKTVARIGYTDNKPEPEYQKWLRNIIALCLKASKGLVWVNHKTRFRDKKAIHPLHFLDFDVYSEIVWDRGGSITLNAKKFAPSHEFIYGFGTPHFWDSKYNVKMSVWRMHQIGHNTHPCAFPMTLPLLLISASCPPNGIVLDPFMGSGTTLRAARLLKRRAIGIEKREDYCEYAAKRLQSNAVSIS